MSDNSVVATYMAARVPNQPNTPTKLSADQTQITIQWTAPVDNGGNAITAYKVLWNEGGEGNLFLEVFSCNPSTFTY